MSVMSQRPLRVDLYRGIETLQAHWAWLVVLGVALAILGVVALGAVGIASLATVLVIGWLMLVAGGVEIVGAFWARGWSGFLLHVLSGVLSIVVGALFLSTPLGTMLALSLLLACLLLVGGLFRVVAAIAGRFVAWGWTLLSGIVDVVLGVMIWQQWPASALWVIGMFLGIALVLRGVNWVALGLALHALRPRSAIPA